MKTAWPQFVRHSHDYGSGDSVVDINKGPCL